MKRLTIAAICFLLLFNFSKCAPAYNPDAGKEITLPDHIRDTIRKDAERALKHE